MPPEPNQKVKSKELDKADNTNVAVVKDKEVRARVQKRDDEIKKIKQNLAPFADAKAYRLSADQNKAREMLSEHLLKLVADNEIDRAQIDFNSFAEQVMIDDETGEPIRQAPIHRRWAELCEKHDRLIIWAHVASGKSTQISILRTVWELGRDPTLRIVILSNTASIATKVVKSIANLIKNNEKVQKIFPHLKPNPEGPWTTTELQVVRSSASKDPSVRGVGVHGALTAARVDRLIVDDILDPENVDTEANRRKLQEWYRSVAISRLTNRSKIIVVGVAWHPDDLLHQLSKHRGWKWIRFPVITSKGVVAWPEAWPSKRIEQMREELGPAEFARQLLCKARDDDESRFKQKWIDIALKRGNGLSLVRRIEDIPEKEREGCHVFTGVDLAVKKTKKADSTVMFTFLEYTNGDRRVLDIERGKFTAPEIMEKLIDVHDRYGSIVAVENNAAQDYLLQFTRESTNIPIVPHTTTKAKRDPILGVEGLAVELANGKWIIPNDNNKCSPEIEVWITEMLFYTPKAHSGDTLMACWFSREIARKKLGNRRIPKVQVRMMGSEHQKPDENGAPVRTSPLSGLFPDSISEA